MKKVILISSLLFISANAFAFNTEMKSYIQSLKVEAIKANPNFKDFSIKNGEKIFTTKHLGKKGEVISCTSCHNIDLSTTGKNYFTNKEIEPLSPNTNSKRLVEVKEVKKWLRRNFKDVYNRVGTAQEKGDVLYYINSK
jgi:cytochrome c peroxidase